MNTLSVEKQSQIIESVLQGNANSLGFNWGVEQLVDQLKVDQGSFLELNTKPVAFIIWKDLQSEAEIISLATSPKVRRQGLMNRLLQQTIAANGQISIWWLEVHAQNIEALNLYKKMGFEMVRERQRYYSDGSSALILRKTTTP